MPRHSDIRRVVASLGAALILTSLTVLGLSGSAQAVPSFARQTGQPCAACHTVFPELTPFGRRFKLGGYTLGGGDTNMLPITAMVIGSFTHTTDAQDAPPADGFGTNDNFSMDQLGLFYAGTVFGDLGAFVQTTYDGVAKTWALDNTDIRFAKSGMLFGKDAVFGISVNNSPTVQDAWNTTPVWGFPQFSSALAPQFSPPSALIQGGLGGQVVGTSVYTFWNDMIYAEAGAYVGLPQQIQNALGTLGSAGLGTVAPYARLAIEKNASPYNMMAGLFVMAAKMQPDFSSTNGTDDYVDLGFDAQFQYMGMTSRVTLKASNITEWQTLNSSFVGGASSNLKNTLNITNISAAWTYQHKYTASIGYFGVIGSADQLLYQGGASGGPMLSGNPNGSGLILDLSWSPFMDGGPKGFTSSNFRLGFQYTHYLTLFGGSTNFDGNGHSAQGNDTAFLYLASAL